MLNKYPSSRFQNLKQKVLITDVLELISNQYLPWNGMICCPIHDDRTPSMKIYTEGNRCHCFGACGRSFDPISLYSAFQEIRPSEALEQLEAIFKVVWDGSAVDEDNDTEPSPWSLLEKALFRQCKDTALTNTERIRKRHLYWYAELNGQNCNMLEEAIGEELASKIISKWEETLW